MSRFLASGTGVELHGITAGRYAVFAYGTVALTCVSDQGGLNTGGSIFIHWCTNRRRRLVLTGSGCTTAKLVIRRIKDSSAELLVFRRFGPSHSTCVFVWKIFRKPKPFRNDDTAPFHFLSATEKNKTNPDPSRATTIRPIHVRGWVFLDPDIDTYFHASKEMQHRNPPHRV